MVGKPKGRSIKALRERCDALASDSSTRTVGINLTNWHEKVLVAKKWRGGAVVMVMEDKEISDALDLFEATETVLPADICQALLERHSERLATSRKWSEYLEAMLPFTHHGGAEEFDPRKPSMRSLPRVQACKSQAFLHSFMEKLVGPFLFEGSSSSAVVLDIMVALLNALEGEDALMMEKASASLMVDLESVAKAVKTILELPFESSCSQLVKMAKGDMATKCAPMDQLSAVISEAPWYSERAEKFMKALPTIIEMEAKVIDNLLVLEVGLDFGSDAESAFDSTLRLTTMLSDLGKILNKVECSTIANFSKTLLEATAAHVKQWIAEIAPKRPQINRWDELLAMLNEASIAFPLDARIMEWTTDLQDLKLKCLTSGRKQDLVKALSSVGDTVDDACCDELERLSQACAGTKLDGSDLVLAEKVLDIVATTAMQEQPSALASSASLKLFDLLLGFILADSPWVEFGRRLGLMGEIGKSAGLLKTPPEPIADVAMFRKVLQEVKDADRQPQAFDHKIGQKLLDDVADLMGMLANQYGQADAAILKAAATKSFTEYDSAKESLLTWAYGEQNSQVAWTSSLSANSSMEILAKTATEKKLLDLPLDTCREQLTAFAQAFGSWVKAEELCGNICEEKVKEVTTSLQQRAILTIVEAEFIKLATHETDKDTLRAKVQGLIRELRKEGLKEKQALMASMYRYAFSCITGR